MAAPAPPAPPCTLANLESRRFGDTWPIECAGVTLTLDQQVANFNNADLTGGHFEGFKLETDFNIDLRSADLTNAHFDRASLFGDTLDFSYANLQGADFASAQLRATNDGDGRSAARQFISCRARSSEYFRQRFLL